MALAACGPSPAPETDREADTAGAALPATDRDPLPYTPPATTRGRTGETVALTASGGEDQARRMLPSLLEALRDADENRLESLFADEIFAAETQRRAGRGRPRAAVVQRILIYARRAVIPANTTVDELVELEAVEVTRAAHAFGDRDMPDQVRPTDLVVEVPIREPGRAPLRTMLGWHLRGRMVVRPGADPRIVAL